MISNGGNESPSSGHNLQMRGSSLPPIVRDDPTGALDQATRQSLVQKALDAIIKNPEHTEAIIEAHRDLITAHHPIRPSDHIRFFGARCGVLLSIASITGAVAVAVVAGPAFISVGLLCIGAASIGGTFVLASGRRISADEYSKMLAVLKDIAGSDNLSGS